MATKSKDNPAVTRAMELDKKIRMFQQHQRANWFEMGSAVLKMQESKAYQLLGYKTFEHYQSSFGESRSLIFEAKGLVEAFADVPKDRKGYLVAASKENLKLLAKLPERQRFAKDYLDAAVKMKTRDLRKKLDGKGYHLDQNVSYKFSGIPHDALPMIEEMHKTAKSLCTTSVDQGGIHPLELIAKVFNDWAEKSIDKKKVKR